MEDRLVDRTEDHLEVLTEDRSVGPMEGPMEGRLEGLTEALTEDRLAGLQDLSEVRVALNRFAQLALVRIQALLQVLRELGLEVASV